jgi:hypothetical protein
MVRRERSGPRRTVDREEAREDRRRRAREEALDVRPRNDRPYPSFEVRNPVRGTHYRVLAPGAPEDALLLCPCPDFGLRDVGTCKHVEAVRSYRARDGAGPSAPRTDAPDGSAWPGVEEELARLPEGPWRSLRPADEAGRRALRLGETHASGGRKRFGAAPETA